MTNTALKTGIALLLATIISVLSGCQTTGSGGSEFNAFFDQGDKLEDLVKAGKWSEVATLYEQEKAFFTKQGADKEISANLRKAMAALESAHRPRLGNALSALKGQPWPTGEANWASVKSNLENADDSLRAYSDVLLLTSDGGLTPLAEKLRTQIAETQQEIRSDAKDRFLAYDHFGKGKFFLNYPVSVDPQEIVEQAMPELIDRLQQKSPADIAAFKDKFNALLTEEAKGTVGRIAFEKLFEAEKSRGGDDLDAALAAVAKAKAIGLEPKGLSKPRIGFIEVTSRTLLGEGQIEFPAAVDVDLPVAFDKAGLEAALHEAKTSNLDYLVIFDVAVAKNFRRVASEEIVDSEYRSGTKSEPNPARASVQIALQQAQQNLNAVKMRRSMGCIGCGLIPAMIWAANMNQQQQTAQQHVQAGLNRLNNTPIMLEKPVFSPYTYSRAHVDVTKVMSVNYYVIDLNKRTYLKSFFNVNDVRKFTVAYKLKKSDRQYDEHLQSADMEKDVANFEDEPVSVQLSAMLDHYRENRGKWKKLSGVSSLRKQMLKDKNVALAKYKENTFDARPLNDPRFDSVVVVYNPEGGVGSGFFVRPDLVLTNYHVIKGSKYAEMKLYDGQETFGKIVKTDIRMDLALVRVQSRGKPVRFYTRNTLDLGQQTEAIGHPGGLNFSVTRGVVSAVRKLQSRYAPGGNEILFVQTDTPINPGNSGGPLFLDDNVIGVNTQKLVAGSIEGLGFAIHYSEIQKFLSGNLGS